jgi:hypothetical protein
VVVHRDSMISALDPVFAGTVGQTPNLNQANGNGAVASADAVYECYLYALVLKAMHELQYNIKAVPSGTGPFVFRRGRGNLFTLKRSCSLVEFSAHGTDYELLCDVKTSCRSPNVDLEVDILVIPKQHSDDCATKMRSPSFNQLKLLIEAKHFVVGVDVTTSKSFVGSCDRLREASCVASLVTSGTNSSNSKLLLGGVNPPIDLYSNVYGDPNSDTEARNFVEFLKSKLPKVL